jgi:hypothetical protein
MPVHTAARRISHRPRELRRRVMLRARMRSMSGWSDACILNVSSRGLMINAPWACAAKDSTIELWHGEHVIVATVVWRKGARAGLQAEGSVPVDDILAISQSPSLQLTAGQWPEVDRRRKPRTADESRHRARAIEFTAAVVIALLLAAGAFELIDQALARPLTIVEAALGR